MPGSVPRPPSLTRLANTFVRLRRFLFRNQAPPPEKQSSDRPPHLSRRFPSNPRSGPAVPATKSPCRTPTRRRVPLYLRLRERFNATQKVQAASELLVVQPQWH